jgi:hypothetical protein
VIRDERPLEAPLLSAAYLVVVSITLAITGHFGKTASIVDSAVGIGVVLILRDRLADIWGVRRAKKMLALIFVGGLCALAVNIGHPIIGVASGVAFASAEIGDGLVYYAYRRRPWQQRVTASNVAFALVDSLVFPSIAFGAFDWKLTGAQFAAKVLGSVAWGYALRGLFWPRPTGEQFEWPRSRYPLLYVEPYVGLGLIERADPRVHRLFGYGVSELNGAPLTTLIPTRLHRLHDKHVVDFRNNPQTRPMGLGIQLLGRCKDQSEIPIEIGLEPMENGLVRVSVRDLRRSHDRSGP